MSKNHFNGEPPDHRQLDAESTNSLTAPMPAAKDLVTRSNLLRFAVDNVSIDGLWLEFGVYKGKSIRKIAVRTDADIYGFDSFEGLPEDWILSYRQGDFSLKGRLPQELPTNVKLVKGEFSETLPAFIRAHHDPVAFVHIDCDLYHSTRTIFTHLRNNITAGTVILFDEFHNFPGWQQHEYRAFMEFIDDSRHGFDYIGFASAYNSVAARIAAFPDKLERMPSRDDDLPGSSA